MTKNEVEKLGEKLAQYIEEELYSYNLYFDFETPTIRFPILGTEGDLSVQLWGYELPEDVSEADEGVLTKFLKDIVNEFISSYDIEYNHYECECFIYDDDSDVANFGVCVYDIKIDG